MNKAKCLSSIMWYFQSVLLQRVGAQSSCIGVPCPVGQICNIDTDECVILTSALNTDPCSSMQCPSGSGCDPVTGRCVSLILQQAPPRPYRTTVCSNITCSFRINL